VNHAIPTAAIREGSLDEILDIHQQVPELEPVADVASYEQRLAGRRWLGLVAEYDGRPAAFKLGYWQNERCFYSWVGGVIPSARRAGLAKALLDAQELRLLQLGVGAVTVKSMNRFPAMMALLITNGYWIVGLEGDDPATSKICFSKPLREVAGRGG
jgi:GNAT superfamily N-acetyltransferase